MSLTYEECKALKDAGFPQRSLGISNSPGCPHYGNDKWIKKQNYCGCFVHEPTLSELIEECGERFESLCKSYTEGQWVANAVTLRNGKTFPYTKGSSPEQALCALYLALQANKK